MGLFFGQEAIQYVQLEQLVDHVAFKVATENWSLQLSESRLLQKLLTQRRSVNEAHKVVGVVFIKQFVDQLKALVAQHSSVDFKPTVARQQACVTPPLVCLTT